MRNDKNQNQNQNNGLDLFTPIVEIIHELAVMIFKILFLLGKFAWRKFMNMPPPIEKIERGRLGVRKVTDNSLALGIDTKTKKPVLLSDIDFRRHSFIVGASGFGKTNLMSILQEHSLKTEKPIIFFDPKGDLGALTDFKRLCAENKRPCYIFSEHYKGSITLNPFKDGSINNIADRIMKSYKWESEFYHDCCKSKLYEVLEKITKEEKEITLERIHDYYKSMMDTNSNGLLTRLQSIKLSDFGEIFGIEGGLTVAKIREERACLYIGLSTQGYGETATAIGKILLGELLFNSYQSLTLAPEEALKNPISVYFDEFGSLVSDQFIELQNKCRGAGIELTLAVQTSADIDKVSPDLTRQVIENAGNLFILKQRLQYAAELFSEAIGTGITKKQTYRVENGEKQAMASEREVHELLVHPDIIKNLNVGQCVLLRQGPTRLNLVNVRSRKFAAVQKLNQQFEQNSNAFSN